MQQASQNEYVGEEIQIDVNPGRILVTLYDAAISSVSQARNEIDAGDVAAKGVSLGRAHAIISELNESLDHAQAPELCGNLEQVYGFMIDQMSSANCEMDARPLESVLTHLTDLRDTWFEAVSKYMVEYSPVAPMA